MLIAADRGKGRGATALKENAFAMRPHSEVLTSLKGGCGVGVGTT